MANDDIKSVTNAIKDQEAAVKRLNREYKELQTTKDADSKDIKAAREELEKQEKALRRYAQALEEIRKKNQNWNNSLDKTASTLGQVVPGIDKVTSALKKNEEGVIDVTNANDSFIAGMFSMMKTIEEVNVSLAKQTGYATALRQDVIDLASSHDDLYLSMNQSAEVVGALSTGFRMYNAQSKQTRGEINYLAGRFKTLGVDTNAFATVLDQLNEGFGLTGAGAISAAAELENLAIRTGSPLASVVSDFQDLGPQMSRFGSDGVRVFARLSEQARTLGLTVRQVFDLAELVDTFEGAADVAGKLNAQLGLQLNSVELMGASREDVLKIMRAEFEMEGLRFDQMGRRQRQMVADILQTDALTAEKLLGDPMALREFQREEENRNERMKNFNTAMEKFVSVGQKLFINLSPLLTGIMKGFNFVAEILNTIVTGPFGEVISKIALFGSMVVAVSKSTFLMLKPLHTTLTNMGMKVGTLFGFVAKALGLVIAPILMFKDAIQSIPGVGDSDSRSAARARLAAGIGGAATGAAAAGLPSAGFGAIPGAFVGYSIGREVPGVAAGFANDKMETIKGSAVLKRSDGSMTRFAAGDTFTARKDGGDLSQLVKGINQMVDLMKKSNDRNQEVVLNLDGETLARSILPDPTKA